MTTTRSQKQEEPAILAVLKGVYDAWNEADPDAFVSEYREDASAIMPGSYLKSRKDIHDAMASSFNGPLKGTRTSDELLDVRFLNDDAVVVVSRTGVLLPGESAAPPERTSYATWVLARQHGKWLLAAYSNTPSVAR
ncbi:MAG: SgcJ/EcaC family oxidoreductase [Nakamurella sp.]